jgi:hypothetical protein
MRAADFRFLGPPVGRAIQISPAPTDERHAGAKSEECEKLVLQARTPSRGQCVNSSNGVTAKTSAGGTGCGHRASDSNGCASARNPRW